MHFLLIVEYLYAFTMTKIVILGKQTYICCILISKGIYFTRLTNKKLVVNLSSVTNCYFYVFFTNTNDKRCLYRLGFYIKSHWI